MVASTRASEARAFIQRCRQQTTSPTTIVIRASSTSSQYSPSNFGKAFIPPSAASSTAPISASTVTEANAPWDRPLRAPNLYHHPSARSRPIPPSNAKFTFTNWLRSLFGLRIASPATTAKPPFSIHNNPYRARKSWPPDFARLHAKQQFHFEKTYRRRAALKWARPNWTRWVKLIQHTLVVTITIYFVFICAPDEGTPFDGFRVWFFGKMRTLTGLGEGAREEAERLEVEMKKVREERIRKQKGEKTLLEETVA